MTDSSWRPADAATAYNIPEWSEGYVAVGQQGHLLVQPRGAGGPAIDLAALTRRLPSEGLELPVLLRFGDILADRIRSLVNAFDEARAALDYAGGYTLVYPIKVNQQQTVVAGIVRAGGQKRQDTARAGAEIDNAAERAGSGEFQDRRLDEIVGIVHGADAVPVRRDGAEIGFRGHLA